MANWRELKRLRERYSLLAEWYGGDFAVTEFAAPQHTPRARAIGELLPAVLKEVTTPEAAKLLQMIEGEDVEKLKAGVSLDGEIVKASRVKIKKVDTEKNHCLVEITIHEGKVS